MKYSLSLALLFFVGSRSLFAGEPVSLKSLLNEMVDRAGLSRMPDPPYCAKAATSYDRESKVNNPADGLYVEKKGRDWGKGWFANRDFGHCIRVEPNGGRTEHVLLDDQGPGAIVRWWATANNNGTIRIYLDGASEPVIAMKPAELVGGNGLVSWPFSLRASDENTNPAWRGHDLYLPIPYQYVDGESFPSIFGTGTEDYFGYAYCRPQRFSTPFMSQPRGEGNKKWGYSNNNRYHLLDDIPFTKSVQFDMEIWHPFRKNMNYAAATFFYARPGASCNIEPDVEAVRQKVALHRDEVVSLEERRLQ